MELKPVYIFEKGEILGSDITGVFFSAKKNYMIIYKNVPPLVELLHKVDGEYRPIELEPEVSYLTISSDERFACAHVDGFSQVVFYTLSDGEMTLYPSDPFPDGLETLMNGFFTFLSPPYTLEVAASRALCSFSPDGNRCFVATSYRDEEGSYRDDGHLFVNNGTKFELNPFGEPFEGGSLFLDNNTVLVTGLATTTLDEAQTRIYDITSTSPQLLERFQGIALSLLGKNSYFFLEVDNEQGTVETGVRVYADRKFTKKITFGTASIVDGNPSGVLAVPFDWDENLETFLLIAPWGGEENPDSNFFEFWHYSSGSLLAKHSFFDLFPTDEFQPYFFAMSPDGKLFALTGIDNDRNLLPYVLRKTGTGWELEELQDQLYVPLREPHMYFMADLINQTAGIYECLPSRSRAKSLVIPLGLDVGVYVIQEGG